MYSEQTLKGVAPAAPVFNFLGKNISLLSSVMLCTLVTLVSLEVFLRSVFGYSFGFVEEVTGYLVVALTLFGAAMAVRANSLFQVQMVFDILPYKLRRLFGMAFTLIAIVICVVLALKTFDLVDSSFSRGKFAPTVLRTPLWIPQTLLPLGFTVIGVFLAEHLLILFRMKEGHN
ncbi:TRAP transporter small permease [Marinomonas shanghaiensis]|jgi:TRAP-type C4-dicarboxylate transport system permease small subunit|uniref:TRAP transporter small permease n=1 Tax=Marinomonas shanghaiensis TaxID=2202418 RepID=UPI000DBAA474|nr:TRAP transporter small permease [Marinomonas shanghaiensis]